MDYVYFEKLLSENKDVFEKIQCEEQYKELKTKIKVDQERNSSIGKGAKKSVERLADCYIILERVIEKHKVEPILSVSKKLQGMIYEDLKIAAERRKNNKEIVSHFCSNGYIKVPVFIKGTEYYLYGNKHSAIWSPVDYDKAFTEPTITYESKNIQFIYDKLYLAYNYSSEYAYEYTQYYWSDLSIPLNKKETKTDIFIWSKTTIPNENYYTFNIPYPQKQGCFTIKTEAKSLMDCIEFTNCDHMILVSSIDLNYIPQNLNCKLFLLFNGEKERSAFSYDCNIISAK